MILGLTGRAQSGKDTVYHLIKESLPHIPVERRAFADKLKASVAALLGITLADVERLKTDGYTHLTLLTAPGGMLPPSFHVMNMRELLQRYGTEAHRNVFGEDFWLAAALPPDDRYNDKLVVVTDVRYPNEADWIHELGGVVVSVVRSGIPEIAESNHASEQPLSYPNIDFVLLNDQTVEHLKKTTLRMLNYLFDLHVD